MCTVISGTSDRNIGDAGVAVVVSGEDKELEHILQVKLCPSEYISTAAALS